MCYPFAGGLSKQGELEKSSLLRKRTYWMAETDWADIVVDRRWACQAAAEGLGARVELYMTLDSNDSLISNLQDYHCTSALTWSALNREGAVQLYWYGMSEWWGYPRRSCNRRWRSTAVHTASCAVAINPMVPAPIPEAEYRAASDRHVESHGLWWRQAAHARPELLSRRETWGLEHASSPLLCGHCT